MLISKAYGAETAETLPVLLDLYHAHQVFLPDVLFLLLSAVSGFSLGHSQFSSAGNIPEMAHGEDTRSWRAHRASKYYDKSLSKFSQEQTASGKLGNFFVKRVISTLQPD